jgi:hypothetical protein
MHREDASEMTVGLSGRVVIAIFCLREAVSSDLSEVCFVIEGPRDRNLKCGAV